VLIECLGEFWGTLFLIILGDGVVAGVLLKQSKAYHAGWIAITTGWCIAVVIGIFVAQSAGSPNADINPAVSFAKYWLNLYSFNKMLSFMVAQIAGAFVGAIIVWLAYLPHFQETEEALLKLMVFCTVPAIRKFRYNFLCEVIATAVLIMGVAAIFGKATPQGPVSGLGAFLVGLLVWGVGLSLGGPTGYAINPARDFGSRLAHAFLPIPGKGPSDWSYAWIPVIAPLVGGFIAAICWRGIFL